MVSNVLGETAAEGVASVAVTTGRRLISAVAEEEDAVAQGRSVMSALFSSETGVTERIGEETFTLWLVWHEQAARETEAILSIALMKTLACLG